MKIVKLEKIVAEIGDEDLICVFHNVGFYVKTSEGTYWAAHQDIDSDGPFTLTRCSGENPELEWEPYKLLKLSSKSELR